MQKDWQSPIFKKLSKLYKELLSIYTLTEIKQEALNLCLENGKDCTHITIMIDLILNKFKTTLDEFEKILNYCNKREKIE